jgi:hypothetical protein
MKKANPKTVYKYLLTEIDSKNEKKLKKKLNELETKVINIVLKKDIDKITSDTMLYEIIIKECDEANQQQIYKEAFKIGI